LKNKTGHVCIHIQGEFHFTAHSVKFTLPKKGAKVTGACFGDSNRAHISLSWEDRGAKMFSMQFSRSAKGGTWHTTSLDYKFTVNKKVLSGSLNVTDDLLLSGATGHSYACKRNEEFADKDARIDMDNVKLQPLPSAKSAGAFDKADICPDDKPSNAIPVAVGCSLAAIVLIVLVVYIVMRKRDKSVPYQQV